MSNTLRMTETRKTKTAPKEMHSGSFSGPFLDKDMDESNKNGCDSLLTIEKDESNSKGSNDVLTEDANSGINIEHEGSNHDVDNNMKVTCGSPCIGFASMNDHFTQLKDIGDNCAASEFSALVSDHPFVDPKLEGYSDHQILNYNELLKQYYELEQRKEKIAEQLWQANYWNYQTPAQYSTSQEQQVPVSSGTELSPNIACPRCSCHCLNATSNLISACPMARALSMGIASCPQQKCCSGSHVQQDAEEKKEGEHDLSSLYKGKELLSTCTDTDLVSVLNAWYLAGYRTGRYLLKQEQSDKQNKEGCEKQ